MIYLYLLGVILLGVSFCIGNNIGYLAGLEDCGICEECEEDIFAAGFHAGVEDVLEKQEAHMNEIIVAAQFHNEQLNKEEPKKKAIKKAVAKKTVLKKK